MVFDLLFKTVLVSKDRKMAKKLFRKVPVNIKRHHACKSGKHWKKQKKGIWLTNTCQNICLYPQTQCMFWKGKSCLKNLLDPSEGVNRLVSMIHLVDIWAWIAKRLLGRFSPSSQWIRIAREVIIFTHIHTHKGVFFYSRALGPLQKSLCVTGLFLCLRSYLAN